MARNKVDGFDQKKKRIAKKCYIWLIFELEAKLWYVEGLDQLQMGAAAEGCRVEKNDTEFTNEGNNFVVG